MSKQQHWYHFLAPRYWPTWAALGILRLSVMLPYSWFISFGAGIGGLFRVISRRHQHIVRVNLTLCYPQLSDLERETLLRACFRSAGIGLLEIGLAWWASDARLKKMIHFEGAQYLEEARAQNRGVLLLTAHFTSIELGLRLLSLAAPVNVMQRTQKNALFEWMIQRRRSRYAQTLIPHRQLRLMLKALRMPGVLTCYLPDQDMSKDTSVFAPFFNILASTVVGAHYFVKKTDAVVLPGFYYRLEKEKKYLLRCEKMLADFPSGDDVADAACINAVLEMGIRQFPEQYFWQHRRFKTRPAGEKDLYKK